MEFDTDRRLVPTRRIEVACWWFIVLFAPLVNGLTVFTQSKLVLILLLLVLINLVLLPAYLFHALVVVPVLLFKKKYTLFSLITAATYVVLLSVIAGIYSLLMKNNMTSWEYSYFHPSGIMFMREALWITLNLVLATGVAFLKRSLDEKLAMAELKREATLLRLKYLRTQVKPHFLFNSLNSIYSLSLQESNKTPGVIIKLADIMRYLIYAGDEQKVLLAKEIEFIENYIEMEKVRFNADVRFSVEGKADGIMVEPFLFISFIENAFKHALDDSKTRPFIYITLKIHGDTLGVTVVNNTDIDLETQAKRLNEREVRGSKGLLELLYPDSHALNIIQTEKQERKISEIGLRNARERLEILYPDSHTLDVIFNNNVFSVALLLKISPQ